MRAPLKDAAVASVSKVLERRGYSGLELELARLATIEWAKARRTWLLRGTRSVAGRGVVITSPGRAQLRQIELSRARSGELTVEVLVSAVSPGTERAEWLRRPSHQRSFPYMPGYSGAGRVLASGDGPNHVEPGSVVAVARMPHASVATMPAAYASVIPEGVDLRAASLYYLAIIAGYGVERAGPVAGESLCVIGAGPIGALAHRMALLEHPASVDVVARTPRRSAAVRRAGATFHTVEEDLGALGAGVVIEATGDPAALVVAAAASRPGGTVVLLGSPWAATDDVPLAAIQRKGLRVVGAHISSLATKAKTLDHDPFRELGDRFLAALSSEELVVDDLVGEAVDPREIQHFYRRLATGEVESAHLDWEKVPRRERLSTPRILDRPGLGSPTLAVTGIAPVLAQSASGSLRFAAVGCGDIGYRNARAIARSARGELTLLFDSVERLASDAAAHFGGEPVASIDDAFDPARVDAVMLSVPHDMHAPLVQRATAAGLHIIVEKPLAHDIESAVGAVDAAEKAGVALSVCLPYRYSPAFVAGRSLVEAGALGAPRGAAVVFHDDQPDSYWRGGFSGRVESNWRLQQHRSGGGVLIMSLVHYIDFVCAMLGVEVAAVAAMGFANEGFEIEDEVSMVATFDNGGVATFYGSTSTRGRPPVKVEMWGETGTILLQPQPKIFTERSVEGVVANRWCDLPPGEGGDVRAIFVDRFVDAVLAGRPPDVTAADGLALQAIVEAGYRSIATGVAIAPADLLADRRER